ncbi:TonB-dependent receptor [Pedobacter sp. Leaf194]|uniref:SusC/RagA family TonB-linked outer membrane protein n=1 Tax=Pedobacter sp. Leaf194 TaxID=1736297 RepID=UPI000702959A|nr:TonB-dependent receptor [Pedobacter sp. Leaf194]KQS36766.1 SusC/RagA family TonB-linked outer membrane protein [Pedobacter sp. Leaf194]
MRRNFYLKFCCLLFITTSFLSVHAQERQVSGKIVDKQNQPIAGASVSVKGEKTNMFTDIKGEFAIRVKADNSVLRVSFVGYVSREINLAKRSYIVLTLEESSETLNEVVAIGYGTQKKSDLNSSISTITAKDIQEIPQVSVDQLLQGKAAGVYVSQNSGAPGSNTSVRIRGITSLSAANDPLYVIDGIAISGDPKNIATSGRALALDNKGEQGGGNGGTTVSPLSALNPSDIESIQILKDASATAIYGSRGSNGVVLITTKRGRNGQGVITYEGYYGIRQQGRFLDVMNLPQYARYQNDLADVLGVARRAEFANPQLLSNGTNWQDEIFRTAKQQNHQISLSGAKDGTDYYISGAYINQEGTIIGGDYDRYSFRTNVNGQVREWFKTGVSVSGSRSFENRGLSDNGGVANNALLSSPDRAVRNTDGSFTGGQIFESGTPPNPLAQALTITNTLLRSGLNGSAYADITFVKGLTLRSELNGDFSSSEARQFLPTFNNGPLDINLTNKLTEYYSGNTYWAWKEYLTYKKVFGKKHDLTALAGYEVNQSSWKGTNLSRASFLSNDLQSLNLGDAKTATNNEYKDSQALESFFVRAIYTFDKRYSFTATVRSDKSSKFAPGNQVGIFPSIGASWKISEESFAKNLKGKVDDIRFRVSYGGTGNQAIPNYSYGVALVPYVTGLGNGYALDKVENPLLKWETQIQADAGLDFSVFNSRLDVSVDVYRKTSKDFLFQSQLPAYLLGKVAEYSSAGVIKAPFINGGELRNTGFEFSLTSRNMVGDFKWSTSANMSFNKNRVIELAPGTPYLPASIGVGFLSLPVSRTYVGGPVGQFYGYRVKGIFKTDEQLRNAPIQFDRPLQNRSGGTWLGDIQFEDINGDGKIDENDQTYLGDPNPKFTYGITNNFSFKNFDLTVFLNGSYGSKIFNALNYKVSSLAGLYSNQLASVANYWKPTNPESNIPAPKSGDNPNLKNSDRFLESGSFLRIQNISLGYNFPTKYLSKVKLSGLKVYVSAQNLYTFTNYTGLDPEIGAIDQNVFLSNVDIGRYPSPRIITFGVNAKF